MSNQVDPFGSWRDCTDDLRRHIVDPDTCAVVAGLLIIAMYLDDIVEVLGGREEASEA
jgi:hypothetical protein